MLNILVDIVSFPIKAIKKVPLKVRFYVAALFVFIAAGCFITANQGHARTLFSILGWIFVAATLDVFVYAGDEEKAIELDEKKSLN